MLLAIGKVSQPADPSLQRVKTIIAQTFDATSCREGAASEPPLRTPETASGVDETRNPMKEFAQEKRFAHLEYKSIHLGK